MICCNLRTFGSQVLIWVKNSVSWAKKCLTHGHIAYYTELNLQICNYALKWCICRKNSKCAPDEDFCGHFCHCWKAATLLSNKNYHCAADELSIHVVFCPTLQIFALALHHPSCPAELSYFCIGFLRNLQYVAKICVNKSIEQGEQEEISTLQTILRQRELAAWQASSPAASELSLKVAAARSLHTNQLQLPPLASRSICDRPVAAWRH